MILDALHRETTQEYEVDVYHKLASECVKRLRSVDVIRSIVLCGSLVKQDIVPGWSGSLVKSCGNSFQHLFSLAPYPCQFRHLFPL